VHIHPPSGEPLKCTSAGELQPDRVVLPAALLVGKKQLSLEIS
jgi:hypothetical protein